MRATEASSGWLVQGMRATRLQQKLLRQDARTLQSNRQRAILKPENSAVSKELPGDRQTADPRAVAIQTL